MSRKGDKHAKTESERIERRKAARKRWAQANPDRVRALKKAWRARHPESRTADYRRPSRAAWYAENKERLRAKRFEKDYGITLEEYERMLVEQNGVCAICREPETWRIRGELAKLSVDHDHVTGQVRGLLCCNCNHMIGKAQDSPSVLRDAAAYLERASTRRT